MRDVAVIPEATGSGTHGEARALDRSLLRGVAWTAAAKWASQALSWLSWLIVARLLTPEDYGLVGMAAIYLGLITLVAEFGLGTAVLAVRELSVAQINQLNGLAVLLGLASLVASCVMAIPLGRFFHAPQLPLVVAAMSTTFVITSFKTVPLALLQRELRYKALALISRLCWYASANADFLVAGRILGKAALGFYNVGWTLASVSVDKITALVGQVTPAFFSAVQRDTPAMRRYLLKITEGIALITFPVSVGLALVARDFVLAVLGSKWEATIAPLQILAAYAAVRSITPLLPQVLHTIRDTKVEMWTMVAAAVVMPTSFYFSGQRWGTVGLAMAWVLMDPLITTILYWRVFSKIDLSPRAYLMALWPAVSGTALMAAVVLAVGVLSGGAWTAGLRLAAQIGAGVISYGLGCLVLHRERFEALRELVTAARQDPRGRL